MNVVLGLRISVLFVGVCIEMLHAQTPFDRVHSDVVAQHARWLTGPRLEISLVERRALHHEIAPMLTHGIISYLESGEAATPKGLKTKLVAALSEADVNPDIASVAALDGGRIFVVAYDVSLCSTCSTSWLGIFERVRGKYVLRDSTENAMHNRTIKLEKMGSGLVLLSGVTWGDAHTRMQVRMYSTKDKLKVRWSSVDLPGGVTKVKSKSEFSLRYRTSLQLLSEMVQRDYLVVHGSVHLIRTTKLKNE